MSESTSASTGTVVPAYNAAEAGATERAAERVWERVSQGETVTAVVIPGDTPERTLHVILGWYARAAENPDVRVNREEVWAVKTVCDLLVSRVPAEGYVPAAEISVRYARGSQK